MAAHNFVVVSFEESDALARALDAEGIEVLYDDRRKVSTGVKFPRHHSRQQSGVENGTPDTQSMPANANPTPVDRHNA